MHVHLRISESATDPEFEPIHVKPLGARRYVIEFTPGLAYDVAAGDEIELADDGTYFVVTRAGNVAIRVLSEQLLEQQESSLTYLVEKSLSGRLDGNIGRRCLAYTVPIQTGFPAIEKVFSEFIRTTPGSIWEYGNVYDKNGQPLNWWQSDT